MGSYFYSNGYHIFIISENEPVPDEIVLYEEGDDLAQYQDTGIGVRSPYCANCSRMTQTYDYIDIPAEKACEWIL